MGFSIFGSKAASVPSTEGSLGRAILADTERGAGRPKPSQYEAI
jgi:hypothetical protein